MRGTVVAGAAVVVLAVGGSALWVLRDRGPTVVEPGQALPYGESVELRFPADDEGEAETWKLSKRETSREESLRGFDGSNALPNPNPPEKDRPVDEAARVLNDHARDAWRGGEVEKALELYAKAVEADPDDWVPHAQYGRLLAIMRDDSRARPLLERAAELSPGDPQRWLDLQTLYEHTLQLDLAFEARRRADALSGGRPIVQDWAGFWTIEGAEEIP